MRTLLCSSAFACLLVFGCCTRKSTPATDPAGPAVEEKGHEGREAPRHNAPDQERIDSLKQEKLKDK